MSKLFWLGSLTGVLLIARALAADGHRHDDHGSSAYPSARRTTATNLMAAPIAKTNGAATNQFVLPPAPQGVTDLKFSEFFKPIGPRGLEYTDKMRSLAGKKVRLLGYMARQSEPKPGLFLFTPVPLQMNEHEYGLAEDMPATLVHVFPTVETNTVVPFTPGLMLLTGTLAIGPREEVDGRISSVRLLLDPPAAGKNAPGTSAKLSPP